MSLAKNMYAFAESDMYAFLSNSAYRRRINLDKDIKYCLQTDIMDIVPFWCLQDDVIGINGGFVI